jgi:hypothetical protein
VVVWVAMLVFVLFVFQCGNHSLECGLSGCCIVYTFQCMATFEKRLFFCGSNTVLNVGSRFSLCESEEKVDILEKERE